MCNDPIPKPTSSQSALAQPTYPQRLTPGACHLVTGTDQVNKLISRKKIPEPAGRECGLIVLVVDTQDVAGVFRQLVPDSHRFRELLRVVSREIDYELLEAVPDVCRRNASSIEYPLNRVIALDFNLHRPVEDNAVPRHHVDPNTTATPRPIAMRSPEKLHAFTAFLAFLPAVSVAQKVVLEPDDPGKISVDLRYVTASCKMSADTVPQNGDVGEHPQTRTGHQRSDSFQAILDHCQPRRPHDHHQIVRPSSYVSHLVLL